MKYQLKNKKSYIAFVVGVGLFASLCFGEGASAVSVTSIVKTGTRPLDTPTKPEAGCGIGVLVRNQSLFNVTFSDGWKAAGVFACGRPGCPSPASIADFSPPGESGCFEVTLYPSGGGKMQHITGTICKDKEEEEEAPAVSLDFGSCDEFAADAAGWLISNEDWGQSSVVSKVKNTTLNESWKKLTYAKPTDRIAWKHCYFPGAQKVANTRVTYATGVNSPGSGNHGKHDQALGAGGTTSNSYSPLSSFYLSFPKWSNEFDVTADQLRNTLNPGPNKRTYGNGITNVEPIIDDYTIPFGPGTEPGGGGSLNKASKTLVETSTTGFPTLAYWLDDGTHSWPCNWQQSCSSCGGGDCGEYGPKERSNWLPNSYNGKRTINPATGREENECKWYRPCNSCYTSTCHHSNIFKAGYASGNSATDKAEVKVPYNFMNSASVAINGPPYVFAGQTVTIETAVATTGTRANAVTKGTYATHVNKAKVALIAYVSRSSGGGANPHAGDPCGAFSNEWCTELIREGDNPEKELILNPNGYHGLGSAEGSPVSSLDILEVGGKGDIFNVKDASAGKYFCVAAAVYPSTSGYDDTNMSASGSGDWYVSAPDCRVIAKIPSMQVWGNGMYTAGNVSLGNAQKHVVAGAFHDYVDVTNDNILFGSWVEQNIVANGALDIPASGAALGGAGSIGGRTKGSFGGSHNSSRGADICVLHPLTMSNNSCDGLSIASNSMKKPDDKEALVARFASNTSEGNFAKYDQCNIYGAPSSFDSQKTHVYKCDGNVYIGGNVSYFNNGEAYSRLADIPKIIIQASGNITIACGVTQVDAVLIAGGTVTTCPDGNDNSYARANSLRINGAVLTNRMNASRTYGAATGNDSGTPAEVINYDTSLYLWGASKAASSESGKLDTVYQTELAPRL